MAAKRALTTIQIARKHVTKIDRIAREKGVSRAAVVRWAIEAYEPFFVVSGSNVSTVKQVQQAAEAEQVSV